MECATLSVVEAGRRLGIGRLAIYRAVREGRLPCFKIGAKPRIRIPVAAIEEMLRHPERWQQEPDE